MSSKQTYRSKVIQNIPLSLVRENDIRRDSQRTTSHERHKRRDMGHFRKSIQRRRPQAPINQQRIMMADKSEANDPNCLENPWTNERKSLARVAFKLRCDVWTFYKDRSYDDDHAYERQARCS